MTDQPPHGNKTREQEKRQLFSHLPMSTTTTCTTAITDDKSQWLKWVSPHLSIYRHSHAHIPTPMSHKHSPPSLPDRPSKLPRTTMADNIYDGLGLRYEYALQVQKFRSLDTTITEQPAMEEFHRSLQSFSAAALFRCHTVLAVNRSWELMCGYSSSEVSIFFLVLLGLYSLTLYRIKVFPSF